MSINNVKMNFYKPKVLYIVTFLNEMISWGWSVQIAQAFDYIFIPINICVHVAFQSVDKACLRRFVSPLEFLRNPLPAATDILSLWLLLIRHVLLRRFM